MGKSVHTEKDKIEKRRLKMNDKAFSLVELIVVILIMAIVAVALAPQVMKWVSNSRVASDLQTKADIEKTCTLAITDDEAFKKVQESSYEIVITKGVDFDHKYEYKTKDYDVESPEWPDAEEDAFWKSFLKTGDYSSFKEFEDDTKIKTYPAGQDIVIRVVVSEGGYTYSLLTGIYGEVADIVNDFTEEET